MRLKNIYSICARCLPGIKGISAETTKRKTSTGEISLSVYREWAFAEELFGALREIEFLRSHIEAIDEIAKHNVKNGELALASNSEESRGFLGALAAIRDLASAAVGIGKAIGYKAQGETEPGFDVRLPDGMPFESLIECLKSLNIIFGQCSYLKTGATVRFASMDAGSSWISFVAAAAQQIGDSPAAGAAAASVGAIVFLKKLGDVVHKAVEIRNQKIHGDQEMERLKALRLENELLQSQAEINKALADKAAENAIAELDRKHLGEGAKADPEQRARNKHCINLLAELMKQGMMIFGAIDNSEDIKAAFPPKEAQKVAAQKTSLIEDASGGGSWRAVE
jgi:hypothetical protein